MTLGIDGFSLPASTLKKHVLVVGGTGSGKTVLSKVFVEEAIGLKTLDNVPA